MALPLVTLFLSISAAASFWAAVRNKNGEERQILTLMGAILIIIALLMNFPVVAGEINQ